MKSTQCESPVAVEARSTRRALLKGLALLPMGVFLGGMRTESNFDSSSIEGPMYSVKGVITQTQEGADESGNEIGLILISVGSVTLQYVCTKKEFVAYKDLKEKQIVIVYFRVVSSIFKNEMKITSVVADK